MLDITYPGAFLAGILSFLSPCVLPLVPPYLCFVAGVSLDELVAEGDRPVSRTRHVMASAAAFVAGFITVFTILGATASALGQVLAEHFDLLSYFAGAVLIVLGLHYTGILKIQWLYREMRFHPDEKKAGLIGAYVVGLAFAFGWTPCVGPVLAGILMLAGTEQSIAEGTGLLFAYGLGIGLPFLVAAFFAGRFLGFAQRFRRHLPTVERVLGVLLIITGVLFLTNGMATISYWLLETFPALGRIG
jgi:cytochrome c-type biogenesis protein